MTMTDAKTTDRPPRGLAALRHGLAARRRDLAAPLRDLAVLLCGLAPVAALAAINPAEYTRDAPYQLQLRPLVEIVEHREHDGDTLRRTTIVAVVVAEHREPGNLDVGDTVTIDWTVNLDAQQRDRAAHDAQYGTMPGPQFLHEPASPVLDAEGRFWANLQFDAQATVHPGLVPGMAAPAPDTDHRFGEILVPASHQYSWDAP